MRIPSLLIATALLGSSAWAHGGEDTNSYWPDYLQFGIGGVFTEDASGVPGGTIGFDPGFSTGVALGWTTELSARLDFDFEVEAFYQYFTVDETDILAIPSAVNDDAKTFAVMFNGLVDWHFTQQYSMYGGLGVGWAKEIDYSAWDSGNLSIDDKNGAAFQGRVGFGYNMGGTYDVRLGYRYFKTEPIDIQDEITNETDELDVAQHSVEATFRWGL
jgi:opacity protein-like surface antigen